MKKIACVGYHGTGSGVIDDLFREFDNVYHGTYEAEVRLLHDPDGISDLEYHLVDNPHRLSSGIAIKRFIAYCKSQERQAQKVFGNKWMKLSTKYAEDLALIKYYGYTQGDVELASDWIKFKLLVKKVINRLKPRRYRYASWHNYLPDMQTYYSLLTEDVFLDKTKRFVEELCKIANKDKMEYVMLDQFISSSNPERCLRYIDDIKTIVVDRDPRDLFINQILCGSPVLPKEAYQFCIMYRNLRKLYGAQCKDQFMIVHFEDMIYKYDEYVNKVLAFVGIDSSHHINPKKYFNPNDSGARTKLWIQYPEFNDSIAIIEKELAEFLYSFPENISFRVIDQKANNHHLKGKS